MKRPFNWRVRFYVTNGRFPTESEARRYRAQLLGSMFLAGRYYEETHPARKPKISP